MISVLKLRNMGNVLKRRYKIIRGGYHSISLVDKLRVAIHAQYSNMVSVLDLGKACAISIGLWGYYGITFSSVSQ